MENKIKKFDNKKYKELAIDKIVLNGKEKTECIISADETKNRQELHVTVYTHNKNTVPKEKKGNKIYELFKKGIFHNKRK